MRINAGVLKGRRLRAPDWDGLRPTSDRLRETLFNVVRDRIDDAVVLDGCAGTGALGIEALSRGAREVTFVESDRRAAALIRTNLEHCDVATRGTVVEGALPGALTRADLPRAFDLVLLDPPYQYDDRQIGAILSAAAERMTADGRIVLERPRREPTLDVAGLAHLRRVTSGDSVLEFYGRREI